MISLLIVDRCGRRCLLLVGTGLMLLGITMLGITTIATPYTVHDPCTLPVKLQGSALLHEQSNNTLHSITMTTPETITSAFSMTTMEPSPVTINENNTHLTKRDLGDVLNIHIMERGSQVNLSDENSVISNGTGKTGNLTLTFSRQGKHREFCCDTGKIVETQGKYFDCILLCECYILMYFWQSWFQIMGVCR